MKGQVQVFGLTLWVMKVTGTVEQGVLIPCVMEEDEK